METAKPWAKTKVDWIQKNFIDIKLYVFISGNMIIVRNNSIVVLLHVTIQGKGGIMIGPGSLPPSPFVSDVHRSYYMYLNQ